MIKQFIEDNNLSLKEGSRNSAITTLIGFSQYKGLGMFDLKKELFDEIEEDTFIEDEISRLYNYCSSRNYGKWWSTDEAKSLYKFN